MRLSFRPKLFGEAVQAVMTLLSEWLAWEVHPHAKNVYSRHFKGTVMEVRRDRV